MLGDHNCVIITANPFRTQTTIWFHSNLILDIHAPRDMGSVNSTQNCLIQRPFVSWSMSSGPDGRPTNRVFPPPRLVGCRQTTIERNCHFSQYSSSQEPKKRAARFRNQISQPFLPSRDPNSVFVRNQLSELKELM